MKTKGPKKTITKLTGGIKKTVKKTLTTKETAKPTKNNTEKMTRKAATNTVLRATRTEKKTLSIRTAAEKKIKSPTNKTAKQKPSGPVQNSVKPALKKKSSTAVRAPAMAKSLNSIKNASKTAGKTAPMKKAVTGKSSSDSKPKAVVAKVVALKPTSQVTTEKKILKKTVSGKAKIESKPETKPTVKARNLSSVKPKPLPKTEKKLPKNKAVAGKIEAKKTEGNVTRRIVPTLSMTKIIKTVTKENKPVPAKRRATAAELSSSKSAIPDNKFETGEGPKSRLNRLPTKSSKAKLKIFLPDQNLIKEEPEEIFSGKLPDEYGVNSIMALAVDPNTVFVDWEVIPKDISDTDGELNLRFYDVSGIEFNDWEANSIFDIPINKRVGNGFFNICMPGCDVVVAVGILNDHSGFMPIVRSEMVSFPELLTFDDLGIVQKLFESGIPVGY